mgnify:CR=1 FL=1
MRNADLAAYLLLLIFFFLSSFILLLWYYQEDHAGLRALAADLLQQAFVLEDAAGLENVDAGHELLQLHHALRVFLLADALVDMHGHLANLLQRLLGLGKVLVRLVRLLQVLCV